MATVPASSAGRCVRVSSPATSTRPAKRPPWKCGTSPASERSSVDLPPPEGPSSSTRSPSETVSDTPRTASIPSGYEKRRSSMRARATAPPRRRSPPRPRPRPGRAQSTAAAAPGCARVARSRAPPSPRRAVEARSSEPPTSGETSRPFARTPSTATPRPRSASTRPAASRSSVGTSRVPSATASAERRAKPAAPTRRSWSSSSAYAANASPTRSEPQRLERGDSQLLDVETSRVPSTGTVGPVPERDRQALLEQRREHEHAERGAERAHEVRPAPAAAVHAGTRRAAPPSSTATETVCCASSAAAPRPASRIAAGTALTGSDTCSVRTAEGCARAPARRRRTRARRSRLSPLTR